MSREDEIWLNEQIARDRASQPSDQAGVWLIVAIVAAWFAVAAVLALALRLAEVLRA